MDQKHNILIGSASGILSAVFYMLSIIGLQFYLLESLENMDLFTKNIIQNIHFMIMYAWPGLIATLLIIPFIYIFYRLCSQHRYIAKILLGLTTIGLVFVMIAYLFQMAITYFHAPIYSQLEAIPQASFGHFIRATIGIQDMFWLVGDLFAFLGIASLILLGKHNNPLPNWLLYTGVYSAILAALGSFSFIPEYKQVPGLSLTFIAGFSIFSIWEIVAGIYLISNRGEFR